MSASLIGWIITAVVALILVYSIVMGIVRGMGKSLFRLAWLVAFAIILFFIATPIANAIGKIDISTMNLDIMGPVDKINDIGVNIINELAKENTFLANSEALKTFAETVPAMILSLPIYVLLFYATKWVLWPIWAIISSLIFNRKKRQQKKFKKEQERLSKETGEEPEEMPIELTVTKKKNRLGGALIGLVIGLVMCIVTFMPFIGLNSLYQNVASIKVTNDNGEQVSLIENSINDKEVLDLLSCYENSVASKLLTYTGVDFVSNAMFGYLTTTEVSGEKISLKNEVTNASKIYDDVNTIISLDKETLTQQKLERVLTSAKELLNKMKESSLINVLGNDIIPLFLNDFFEDENFYLIDGARLDEIVKDSFITYSRNFDIVDLENQLESLVDVASSLNNINLIVPFVKGEVNVLEDVITLMGNNITSDSNIPKNIVNGLYEVTLLKDSFPELVGQGVEKLFESLGLKDSYVSQEITPNNLQTSLQTIFSNIANFAHYYAKSENADFGANTSKAFESLGNVVDVLMNNILIKENYDVILDYVLDDLKTSITESGEFSQEAVGKIRTVFDSLKTVDSWQRELYSLSTLYSKVIKLSNEDSSMETLLSEENKSLEGIGTGIKSAMRGGSKLITNENIRNLFEVILENFEKDENNAINEILSIDVYEGTESSPLKERLLNTIYSKTNTDMLTDNDWENEFFYNVAVFKKAYKIIVGEVGVEDLASTNNTILEDIGEAIDNAMVEVSTGKNVTKLIFTNASMRGIINYFFDKWEMPSKANEIFGIFVDEAKKVTVKDQVLSNIYNTGNSRSNVKSWKTEFSKIKNLLGEKFEDTSLKATGKVLDKIKDGKIFDRVVINSIVSHYVDNEVTTKGLGYLQSGIDKMLSKLDNITSTDGFEFEFGNIDIIINQVNSIVNIDSPTGDELANIGAKFNQVSGILQTGTRGSVILDKDTLNEFLKEFFDRYVNTNLSSASSGIKNVASKIKENINDITNYELEMNNLSKIIKCMGSSATDENGDGEVNIVDTGYVLDTMTTSNLINRNIVGLLIENFANENTSSLDQGLKNIIANICTRAKDKNIPLRKYEIEFGYILGLTNALTSSTFSYSEVGKALDNCAGNTTGTSSLLLPKAPIINDIITYYLDKFKTDNLTSSDSDTEAEKTKNTELAGVVEDLKGQVNLISSYQTELDNLDKLFKVVNKTNSEIASVLDSINGTSLFLSKQVINRVVVAFFNKEASPYNDNYGEDYIEPMREKLKQMPNSELKYATMFNDLSVITDAFKKVDIVDDISKFADNASDLGVALDKMEDMQTICDADLTYKMSNKIITNLQGFIDSLTDADVKSALNTALTTIKTKYNYDNYKTNDYTFEGFEGYDGNYYQSMFSELGTEVSKCIGTN